MVKIKILHFSDYHSGDAQIAAFKKYANSRPDLNLVVFSGDALAPCLSGEQAQQVNQDLETIIKSCKKKVASEADLDEAIKDCQASNNAELKEAGNRYKTLESKFDETASAHYEKLKKDIEEIKPQVLMIPGNWDAPEGFIKNFEKYMIHGRGAKLGDLKIAGCGGADSIPKFMPYTRVMPYDEKGLTEFLNKANADIIVSHMPPKGILDGKDKIGSQALVDYIKEKHPKLVLCGHSHSPGVMRVGGTTIVNAGNLGRYFNQTYGTFAEIEIDGDNISVAHYQIQDNGDIKKLDIRE